LIRWWRIRDLNPGPTDYDSAALTTELIRHVKNYIVFLLLRQRSRGGLQA
jgi:hypothetical protein